MISAIIRIAPHEYVHVKDTNLNITKVYTGPMTYAQQAHEKISSGPHEMIKLPPMTYCIVKNPVVKDKDGNVCLTEFKEPRV